MEEHVKSYDQRDFSYSEKLFLATFHEIYLHRILHRILRKKIFRRYNFTNLNDIIEAIPKVRILKSGENFGYRTMHQ